MVPYGLESVGIFITWIIPIKLSILFCQHTLSSRNNAIGKNMSKDYFRIPFMILTCGMLCSCSVFSGDDYASDYGKKNDLIMAGQNPDDSHVVSTLPADNSSACAKAVRLGLKAAKPASFLVGNIILGLINGDMGGCTLSKGDK